MQVLLGELHSILQACGENNTLHTKAEVQGGKEAGRGGCGDT